jgi:hypothetical protein
MAGLTEYKRALRQALEARAKPGHDEIKFYQ